MGLPFEMKWMIITNNKELRANRPNSFFLILDNYQMYPLDTPISISRYKSKEIGKAIVKNIKWANQKTTICYELYDLKKVN